MILVLLGTQNNSFHRLLDEVEKNIENGNIKEEVIVQAGFTKYESNKMNIFDEISRDKMDDLINKSDFIITHAGVGSIINALKKEKKVIVVPRLKKYNEHVNDHQLDIVRDFNSKGYIIGLEDVTMLEEAIKKIKDFKPKKYLSNTDNFIKIIEDYIG